MSTNFTYTKDNGEVSNRVLHLVAKAPAQNVRAIDLSGLSEEDATKIVSFYHIWSDTVYKRFAAAAKQFEKDNLQSFEDFLGTMGIMSGPIIKSFKQSGLKAVEAA